MTRDLRRNDRDIGLNQTFPRVAERGSLNRGDEGWPRNGMTRNAMTKGMTTIDLAVGWTMVRSLAFALFQSAPFMALPAHFV
jgi:hypothetical protein